MARIGRISAATSQLYVCDIQERFRGLIQGFPQVVEGSRRLIEAAKLLSIPIVVTEQVCWTGVLRGNQLIDHWVALGATVAELDVSKASVFSKTKFSMLTEEVLKTANPSTKSIILCGIEAHVCVFQTTLDLLEKGFDVHLVADAVSSRSLTDRHYAIERLRASGAHVTTVESILFWLMSDATHPQFKPVQALVKTQVVSSKGQAQIAWDERGMLRLILTLDHGMEYLSLRGKVAVLGKFVNEGKSSIVIEELGVTVMFSKAVVDELGHFLTLVIEKVQKSKVVEKQIASKENKENDKSVSWCQRKRKMEYPPTDLKQVSPLSQQNRKPQPSTSPMAKRKLLDAHASGPIPLASSQAASIMGSLSFEQSEVLRHILEGKNVFFTGGAGTGKSFLVQQIIKALPRIGTQVTASTGFAACHIGGTTIHSFAGFGLRNKSNVIAKWQATQRLIIDEISMVDAAMFDELEEFGRMARRSKRPFGGIQLIICGDFHQLPPVQKIASGLESEVPEPKKHCFMAKAWRSCMDTCIELKQVFRQSDVSFSSLLGRIRRGECSTDDFQTLLRTRKHKYQWGTDVSPTILCTHLAEAEKINRSHLEALPAPIKRYSATDNPATDQVTASLNRSCVAAQNLELRVGALVILNKNIDVSAGLVNGTRGTVLRFSGMGLPVIDFNGRESTVDYETWSVTDHAGVTISRRQLPLTLAWAISIHKSQGMSLDFLEVNLARVFESGQAYVALSRARTLEGLCVTDITQAAIQADPIVKAFYKSMVCIE